MGGPVAALVGSFVCETVGAVVGSFVGGPVGAFVGSFACETVGRLVRGFDGFGVVVTTTNGACVGDASSKCRKYDPFL